MHRRLLLAGAIALSFLSAAHAQVSIGIGINMPAYPNLVRIPGYPVYYDPRAAGNYFFYDGLFWLFADDNWYASDWYNGPWRLVEPYDVPLYVLRVPVRYYRHPPAYFRGWAYDAPPRWGAHWGPDWERRRNGWDRWDRRAAPPPAPLPSYQRDYRGERYPHAIEQQRAIRDDRYRWQPRDRDTGPQWQAAHPSERPQPQQQMQQHAQPEPRGRGPEQREGRRGGEHEGRDGERGRGEHQ